MKCASCGYAAPEGASFCPECGTRLVIEPVTPAPEAAAEAAVEPAPEPATEPAVKVAPAPMTAPEPELSPSHPTAPRSNPRLRSNPGHPRIPACDGFRVRARNCARSGSCEPVRPGDCPCGSADGWRRRFEPLRSKRAGDLVCERLDGFPAGFQPLRAVAAVLRSAARDSRGRARRRGIWSGVLLRGMHFRSSRRHPRLSELVWQRARSRPYQLRADSQLRFAGLPSQLVA